MNVDVLAHFTRIIKYPLLFFPDNIRLFVKRSCSCGPYIDKKKLPSMPQVIGPAEPNAILRQVVEHVVRCSYSTNKVLRLLSSEKEKKSFLSILKVI
jgi:hypothetical protein